MEPYKDTINPNQSGHKSNANELVQKSLLVLLYSGVICAS